MTTTPTLDTYVTEVMHELWRMGETQEGRERAHGYLKAILRRNKTKGPRMFFDTEMQGSTRKELRSAAHARNLHLIMSHQTRYWLTRIKFSLVHGDQPEWLVRTNDSMHTATGRSPRDALESLASVIEHWWTEQPSAEWANEPR